MLIFFSQSASMQNSHFDIKTIRVFICILTHSAAIQTGSDSDKKDKVLCETKVASDVRSYRHARMLMN